MFVQQTCYLAKLNVSAKLNMLAAAENKRLLQPKRREGKPLPYDKEIKNLTAWRFVRATHHCRSRRPRRPEKQTVPATKGGRPMVAPASKNANHPLYIILLIFFLTSSHFFDIINYVCKYFRKAGFL
jgi:hypothetical protein